MTADRPIDVQRFIDARGLSPVQVLLLVLCFLVVALDGFDLAAIGYAAPAIRTEWGATPAQLAPLFGAGQFGFMIGAFAFGPLADRLGRRAILALSVLFFGVASLASAFAPSIKMLIVLRFVTGFGLGGAMPSAVTLTSEYCPEGRRSFLVMIMFRLPPTFQRKYALRMAPPQFAFRSLWVELSGLDEVMEGGARDAHDLGSRRFGNRLLEEHPDLLLMGLPGISEDRVHAFPKPCRGLARPLLLTRILGGP